MQVGLSRVQSRAQDQRSSPAAAGYRDRDAVVVDREVPHPPVASKCQVVTPVSTWCFIGPTAAGGA